MKPFSLYIHIPFCYQKCPYCDFNTYATSSAPEFDYTGALLAELDYYASLPEWQGRKIQTVYFGGGTPSIFSAKAITTILDYVRNYFDCDKLDEISLEANPGNVTPELLEGYASGGVNRLSFGSQSFTSHILKTLGRSHSPEQIFQAIETALGAGITNLNLDIMYGVPGQTPLDTEFDIRTALQLPITHISGYGLTIEKGTPFFQSMKRGIFKPLPDEEVLQCMEILTNEAAKKGFHRYEISNYAKKGFEARHNMAYWQRDDYLGIGAGAHSFLNFRPSENEEVLSGPKHKRAVGKSFGLKASLISTPLKKENFTGLGKRWSNLAFPEKYSESATTSGQAVAWEESLDLKSSLFETIFLGLRQIKGISLSAIGNKYNVSLLEYFRDEIADLQKQKFVKIEKDHLALTKRGVELSDSVFEFFARK